MRWLIGLTIILLACGCTAGRVDDAGGGTVLEHVELPDPDTQGGGSLAEAMATRRSVRAYSTEPLSLAEIGQLLWAAQGITSDVGQRTAPSAGGTYPLEAYLVTADGVFRYLPHEHHLERLAQGDQRPELSQAALSQAWVEEAAAVFVLAAVYERTEQRYGDRAQRYVEIEVGHAAQNLLLQATALGLGAVPVGAFHDDEVMQVLELPCDHRPLYVIPVGHPVD
jgi:SagB-type dehydrogenase family enzyme